MKELVQLERRNEEFSKRGLRIVVAAMEDQAEAAKTQQEHPNWIVLADEARGLTDAVNVVHQRGSPAGKDIDTPTTIIVDHNGIVRWLFRPSHVITRLSPDALLQAIDQTLKKN